ncbi:MAG: hypothetical protein IPK27_14390 [Rhodanobacteraceae bacterium]|nr:hypothetical protein [Rhodanobacteraceae bacterium]
MEQRGHWRWPRVRVREATAAHVIGVAGRTLQRWREAGIGPAFVVISRSVTYRLADLLAWIDERRHAAKGQL